MNSLASHGARPNVQAMRTPALLALAVLSGCAIGPDRATVLNGLVGHPEVDVIRTFGVPARTYESAGHKFLAYTQQRAEVIPADPFFIGGFYGAGFYNRGFYGGAAFPAEVIPRQCETTFDIAGGVVVTWALRGNACG